jgi:hypothetical protein
MRKTSLNTVGLVLLALGLLVFIPARIAAANRLEARWFCHVHCPDGSECWADSGPGGGLCECFCNGNDMAVCRCDPE